MASTFAQLVELVRAAARLPAESIAFTDTEVERKQRGPLQRVSWVHTGGIVSPYDGAGMVRLPAELRAYRPLYNDDMTVLAHITAEDSEAFERLRQRVLSAAYDVLGTWSTPGRYAIQTEAEEAGVVRGGRCKGTQAFTWRWIIAASQAASKGELSPSVPTRPMVAVTGANIVCEIDNGLEV